MSKTGQLEVDDPLQATHPFLGLVLSRDFKARLCNATTALTQPQIEAEASSAARTFLKAFGTRA